MKSAAARPYKIILVVFALLVPIGMASAQQTSGPASGPEGPTLTDSERQAGNNFHSSFASAEFAGDGAGIVQGAPFSAVGIKETTQILSGGRPFVRRMVTTIYRDSEGRTRYEWGKSAKSEGVGRVPMIFDAVAGITYFLDPINGRAAQLGPSTKGVGPRATKVITPQSPPDNITQVVGEVIEPLGTKIIEGVKAEGVRVTTTVPASETPDKRPGKAIYERWYSQELRRNVLIKSIDPRFGEGSFRLIDIDRKEPARELFQIPVEYKSKQMFKPAPDKQTRMDLKQDEPVGIKLERGDHVSVDNRTTGRIRITGWDKDFVEARATSERGMEAVRFNVGGDGPDRRIQLKADYARREGVETPGAKPAPAGLKPEITPATITRPTMQTSPTPPTVSTKPPRPTEASGEAEASIENRSEISNDGKPDFSYDDGPPLRGDGRPIEVDLEVSVPRYAEIEVIKVIRSNVEVSGVETPLIIIGNKSAVVLKNVGAVEVRNRTGTVEVENASGLVEVVTTSGQVSVRHAVGDVRVLSISGDVRVECARGRVNVDSTDGKIMLSNVQGDVDAYTSNSSVLFEGAIRDDGRYHLKSMSGAVEMVVQDKPPGFTAALSSYRGEIENIFQLKTKQSAQHEEAVNRRVIGSYGNGRAQIMLDTFDGKINLRKAQMNTLKECR